MGRRSSSDAWTAIQREEARNKETGEPFNLTNIFIDAM
jgi:hypothetical protein